jgi:hypothetical protein
MRVSVHPNRPSARTSCRLYGSKTLPMAAKDTTSIAAVTVSAVDQLIGGFEVSTNCRFWLSTEVVTIGIGTLVAAEVDARRLGGDAIFTFAADSQRRATVDEVTADWRRVHAQPGLRVRDHRNVAQLSLNSASVSYLMMQEVSRSADALYRIHPFLCHLTNAWPWLSSIHAITRAGINPYQSSKVRPLWLE